MLDYYLLILIVVLMAPFNFFKHPSILFFSFIVPSIALLFFTVLRFNSAHDYQHYVDVFDRTPKLNELTLDVLIDLPHEWGYLFFNSMFKSIGVEAYIFLAVVSALSILMKLKLIVRVSPYPYLAFVLYFSFVYFNSEFIQTRWAFALAFIYIGAYLLYQKKVVLSFLAMAVAMSVHVAAVVPFFLVTLCAFCKRWVGRRSLVSLVLAAFVIGLSLPVNELLLYIVELSDMGGYFSVKLIGYLTRPVEPVAWHVILRYFVVFCFVTVLFFNAERKLVGAWRQGSLNFNLYFIYCLFLSVSVLTLSFPTFSGRIYIVCEMISSLLISINIGRGRSALSRDLLMFAIIFLSLFYWLATVEIYYGKGYIYDYKTWIPNVIM